jgi:type II secretory pathway pseudopilin PulG
MRIGIGTSRRARGFTIAELVVSLAVAGLVLTSITRLMMRQAQGFRKQREVMDARETGRGAGALLAWELRHAATAGSRPSRIAADSLTIRSLTAFGVVCGKHPTLPRLALWRTAGIFTATAADSAMVFEYGRDTWRRVKITQVGTPADLGVTTCAWAGGRPPDVVVQLAVTSRWDTANVYVGAPLRVFRQVHYAEFEASGRWWLGRRVGAAAGYELLTGPLLSPAEGGLKFTYFDTLNVATTDASKAAIIGVTIRSQSTKQLQFSGPTGSYQVDSMFTKIALRR